MQKRYLQLILIVLLFSTGCIKDDLPKTYNKIVVLGSSTAFGTGPETIDSAWVNLLTVHKKGLNPKNIVINLAKGGYTTYHILPSNFHIIQNRPTPDIGRNITKALTYNPDIIIVNLPSNDASYGFNVEEQMSNFSVVDSICNTRDISLFITTAQPRNFSQSKRNILFKLNNALFKKFNDRIIDFWTNIANSDGTINNLYNSGDGIHLNSKGHRILFERASKKITE